MKAKQSCISEESKARLCKRDVVTRKWIGIITLLCAGLMSLPLAAQPVTAKDAQQEIVRESHQGIGKVVSLDRAKLRIKLAHDPIKTLGWSRMLMDFIVAKAALLDGIKEGDTVQFELKKDKPDDLVWIIAKIERK